VFAALLRIIEVVIVGYGVVESRGRSEKEGKTGVHVIFLQMTTYPDHEIYTRGLNQFRDPILAKLKSGKGLEVYYHYVLVLLIHEVYSWIPKERPVLLSSTERKKDLS
jgi:hypothetical protein